MRGHETVDDCEISSSVLTFDLALVGYSSTLVGLASCDRAQQLQQLADPDREKKDIM